MIKIKNHHILIIIESSSNEEKDEGYFFEVDVQYPENTVWAS